MLAVHQIQPNRRFCVPILLAFVVLLSACDTLAIGQNTSEQPSLGAVEYEYARAAAEAGNYLEAIPAYDRVLLAYPKGKDGAEVRLEFAKVLLYADDPQRALIVAQDAMKLSRARDIKGRGTILSAIADHGQIEMYLAANPPYVEARNRARETYVRMLEAYDKYIDYDEIGIIPARIALLRESLARLELREMQSEIARGETATAAQHAQYIQIEFGDTEIVDQNRVVLGNTALLRG